MKSMSRICIITTVHQALDDRIFYKEARTLKENGFDIDLIGLAQADTVIDGIRIHALPVAGNKLVRFFRNNALALWKAIRCRANAYHFHDPEFYPWAIVLKLISHRPIIKDFHENYHKLILTKEWIPGYLRQFVYFIFRMIEHLSSHFIDAFIFAVPDITLQYRNYKKLKIEIKNFPPLELFPLNKIIDNSECKKFIYIGEVDLSRGIMEDIQAIEKLLNNGKRVCLKIIGPFSDEATYQLIKSYIEKHQLQEAILLTGRIPHGHIPAELSQAFAGLVTVHPTIYNSISYNVKIFEYMVAGIPVIASDIPLYRSFIQKYRAGLHVNPLDVKAIADAMEYLLDNMREAKKMGTNGRIAVLENFNWQNEGKKLIEFYNALFNSSRSKDANY